MSEQTTAPKITLEFVEASEAPMPSKGKVTAEQKESNGLIQQFVDASAVGTGKAAKLVVGPDKVRAVKVRLFHATVRFNEARKDTLKITSWDSQGVVYFKLDRVEKGKETRLGGEGGSEGTDPGPQSEQAQAMNNLAGADAKAAEGEKAEGEKVEAAPKK